MLCNCSALKGTNKLGRVCINYTRKRWISLWIGNLEVTINQRLDPLVFNKSKQCL